MWSGGAIRQPATGAAVPAPSQVATSYQFGKAGQITAGGNLNLTGTGDLTNATPPATGTQQAIPLGPVAALGGAVPAATLTGGSPYLTACRRFTGRRY